MSSQISCDANEDAMSLFKRLIVNPDGSPYIDCETTRDSIESIIERTLFVDDSGNIYINLIE